MPQSLSKCMRPSRVFTSTPTGHDRLEDKGRIWCNRKRFKWQRKRVKVSFVPVQTETAHVPQEEDWEREIKAFSRKMEIEKEKKMSNETPYDAEEELTVALCEMNLYSVPHAPILHQHHYDPSTHHTTPVKWIRHTHLFEADQFADAEE